MADNLPPTEREMLEELCGFEGYPPAPRPRFERAAREGRLLAIVSAVMAECGGRSESSSNSSNTIAPARVPIGAYSQFHNWAATFWPLVEDRLAREGF